MKYDKQYYERYALLTICDILKINVENFENSSDQPDLQNNFDSIGIEVTRAITDHEGYTNALSNKHFGQNKSGKAIKEEILASKQIFKGSIFVMDNDVAVISPSKGLTDFNSHLETARRSIDIKSEKQKSYKKFKKNYLYLFLGHSLFSKKMINEFLSNEIQKTNFDGIMINCIDRIYFLEKSKFKVFKINENELEYYKLNSFKRY